MFSPGADRMLGMFKMMEKINNYDPAIDDEQWSSLSPPARSFINQLLVLGEV